MPYASPSPQCTPAVNCGFLGVNKEFSGKKNFYPIFVHNNGRLTENEKIRFNIVYVPSFQQRLLLLLLLLILSSATGTI